MIDIKIKKLDPKAVIPFAATEHSAGLDLTAVKVGFSHSEDGVPVLVYDTQIAMKIPEGHVGLLFPRSSLANKSLNMTNCVGVVDCDYVGSILLKFKVNTNTTPVIYVEGDRVGQIIIMPYPKVNFIEVDELPETERGEGGYGSTDKIKESEILNGEIEETNEIPADAEILENVELIN